MAWSNFDNASALERDILRRALPTMPSSGQADARATYDPAGLATPISIGVTDAIGFTPEGCVDRLALRPLLVGAAWKVLDLLLEEALVQAGVAPDRKAEYTIESKQRRARSRWAGPTQFPAATWRALMAAYSETVEIRHSLVHRRSHTDAAGALVGVDRAGRRLRPLSAVEQEALARMALAAADRALAAAPDSRDDARLLGHLAALTSVHGQTIAAAAVPTVIPEITIIVDPDPADPDRYLVDLSAVRAWIPLPIVNDYADVVVVPRDRPGQELRGRLEDAPATAIEVNPNAPPDWLR